MVVAGASGVAGATGMLVVTDVPVGNCFSSVESPHAARANVIEAPMRANRTILAIVDLQKWETLFCHDGRVHRVTAQAAPDLADAGLGTIGDVARQRSEGTPMASVTVFVDDAVLGRLPGVCAQDGVAFASSRR